MLCGRIGEVTLNSPRSNLLIAALPDPLGQQWSPQLEPVRCAGVPKGTPVDIVNRLQGGLHIVMADSALREHLTGQGSVMLGGTQKQYPDYMKAGGERWANMEPETGVKAQ